MTSGLNGSSVVRRASWDQFVTQTRMPPLKARWETDGGSVTRIYWVAWIVRWRREEKEVRSVSLPSGR